MRAREKDDTDDRDYHYAPSGIFRSDFYVRNSPTNHLICNNEQNDHVSLLK